MARALKLSQAGLQDSTSGVPAAPFCPPGPFPPERSPDWQMIPLPLAAGLLPWIRATLGKRGRQRNPLPAVALPPTSDEMLLPNYTSTTIRGSQMPEGVQRNSHPHCRKAWQQQGEIPGKPQELSLLCAPRMADSSRIFQAFPAKPWMRTNLKAEQVASTVCHAGLPLGSSAASQNCVFWCV